MNRTRPRLPVDARVVAGALVLIQAGDAVAAGIPLELIRRDLERLGCPPALQRTIPVVKAAAAAGLLIGFRHPAIGRLTTNALLAYFAAALGAHARVGDPAWRYGAALGMTGVVFASRPAYR